MQYVAAARRLATGFGLEAPNARGDWSALTRFPPLYPCVLAGAASVTGLDPVDVARPLQALISALNVWLAARLFRRGDAPRFAAPAAALLASVAPGVLRINTQALSESLFLTTTFLAIDQLLSWGAERSRRAILLCGAASAAAVLTRYAGASIIAFAAVVIAVTPRRANEPRRVNDLALYLVTSAGPLLGWLLRNARVTGDAVARSFAVHSPGRRDFQHGLSTVAGWLSPWELPAAVLQPAAQGMPLILMLAGLLMIRARSRKLPRNPVEHRTHPPLRTTPTLLGFAVAYLAFIVVARTFVDAAVPFDERLLLPLLVVAGPVAAAGAWAAVVRRSATVRVLTRSVVIAWLASLGVRSWAWANEVRGTGQALEAAHWRDSATLAVVTALPDECRIVSNAPDVVYLWTGKPAALLPARTDPITEEVNAAFASELDELQQGVAAGRLTVAHFNAVTWRWYLPSGPRLLTILNDAASPRKTGDGWFAGCGVEAVGVGGAGGASSGGS
ncbi:MAG: hypothetical protein FLDDKLPJ_00827 [Phycisphaerae bacterium]|nr:hypothetical protein [Phycisphaerae bacterium]